MGQFKKFEDIVRSSSGPDDAYNKARAITGVPASVADSFYRKYNPDGKLSQRQSFEIFYNEIKGKVMKTYKKVHKSKKALESHKAKIRARGGIFISEDNSMTIQYSFPEKKEEKTKFKVGDVVANSKTRWIGIVRMEDERGETKTDADGNVDTRFLSHYDSKKHGKYHIAPSTAKELAMESKDYSKKRKW